MKSINKYLLVLSAATVLLTPIVFAQNEDDQNIDYSTDHNIDRDTDYNPNRNVKHDNSDREVDHDTKKQLFNAQISGGWDSLYMYRGVNVLQNNGSSLFWLDLNATLNFTSSDSLKADLWTSIGAGHTSYKETDFTLTYTHSFGNLFVSLGYEFYALTDTAQYQNELQSTIGYNISLGPLTLTPSISYFFDLGPDAITDIHGAVPSASSYLLFRLDGTIHLYKDIVTLAPWISYGQNFRYNAKTLPDGASAFFNGANNWETGIALPIKINRFMTISGYGAYSYNFDGLIGTNPSTFWGGAKVIFSF